MTDINKFRENKKRQSTMDNPEIHVTFDTIHTTKANRTQYKHRVNPSAHTQ